MTNTPALTLLMNAYFHHDWTDESGTPSDIVDKFVQSEPDLAPRLPAEIDDVLSRLADEPTLRQFIVDELGGGYLPPEGFNSWLRQLADRVRVKTT